MSNKTIKERKKAGSILNSILAGNITPESALKEWPEEDDASIKAAKHALIHFIDDDDIRERDKRYENYQLSQLRKFAVDLEKGEPIEADEIEWFTQRNLSIVELLKKVLHKIKGA